MLWCLWVAAQPKRKGQATWRFRWCQLVVDTVVSQPASRMLWDFLLEMLLQFLALSVPPSELMAAWLCLSPAAMESVLHFYPC
jgi:hypothetical protein